MQKSIWKKNTSLQSLQPVWPLLEMLPFRKKLLDFIINNSDRLTVLSNYIRERLLYISGSDILKKQNRDNPFRKSTLIDISRIIIKIF